MSKSAWILILTANIGLALWRYVLPFPQGGEVLGSVKENAPTVYWSLQAAWLAALMMLPLYVLLPVSVAVSRLPHGRAWKPGKLPPYPHPAKRDQLFVVLGEVHHLRKLAPSPEPYWLTIPADGLYTGVQIIGATGSGKSSCCITPLLWQLLGFKAQDAARKLGGLVVEVKGDLCGQVRLILRGHGREEDLIELSLDGEYVYNPLQTPMSPTALAFNMSTLERALYGEGKDAKFWTQASEALLSFLIEMHRIVYQYVTLYDLYKAASNMEVIDGLMRDADETVARRTSVLLDKEVFLNLPRKVYEEVNRLKWEPAEPSHLKTPISAGLVDLLKRNKVPFSIEEESGSEEQRALAERLEFQKIFYQKYRSSTPDATRDNISIGVTVFLQPFCQDERVRRIFSPPKEVYLNGGRYLKSKYCSRDKHSKDGVPLPPLTELIETGAVLALNLPKALDESAARGAGTLLKLDWQRAVELRASAMAREPERVYRDLVWLSDEYQIVATTGGGRPGGDEKFLNLCRASKCISIVAYQSKSALQTTVGHDWETVFSAFQTKIFLRAGEPWTAKLASDMAGKKIRALEHYGFTEGAHKARVSAVTGKLTAGEASVNVSRSYNLQKDLVIEPCDVEELPQGVAVVFPHDGRNPVEPVYCYLKWFGADPNVSYYDEVN